MSHLIIRALGGAAGDLIMTLLHLYNKDAYMNLHFSTDMYEENGKVKVTGKHDNKHPELINFANESQKVVNPIKLKKDIIDIKSQYKKICLKSQFYDKSFDKDIQQDMEVIDIGFSKQFLPFVINANLTKNSFIFEKNRFAKNNRLITDYRLFKISKKLNKDQQKMLQIWMLIKKTIQRLHEFELEKTSISVQDLLYNHNKIENFFKKQGFNIFFNELFFHKWKKINLRYLPSKKYIEYIENKNYNFQDTTISLVERYILLGLTKKNFQFLKE